MPNLIAKISIDIAAPASRVWDALVKPDLIRRYMFGAAVVSDFQEGSPITWTGEWKGKPYQDKGRILKVEPRRKLQYSHFSPLSGLPDTPENHHTVTLELTEARGQTRVALSQDNNATEEAREHSQQNWKGKAGGAKKAAGEVPGGALPPFCHPFSNAGVREPTGGGVCPTPSG